MVDVAEHVGRTGGTRSSDDDARRRRGAHDVKGGRACTRATQVEFPFVRNRLETVIVRGSGDGTRGGFAAKSKTHRTPSFRIGPMVQGIAALGKEAMLQEVSLATSSNLG